MGPTKLVHYLQESSGGSISIDEDDAEEVARQVFLIYGAHQELEEVTSEYWLLRCAGVEALLQLPTLTLKAVDADCPPVLAHSNLSRSTSAVTMSRRKLHWEVELCEKPAEFQEKAAPAPAKEKKESQFAARRRMAGGDDTSSTKTGGSASAAAGEIADLRAKLAASEAEVEDLRAQLRSAQDAEKELDVAGHIREASLQERLEELRKQLAQAKEDAKKAAKKATDEANASAEKDVEIMVFHAENEDLRKSGSEANDKLLALGAELAAERMASALKKCKAASADEESASELARLREELESLREENQALREAADAAEIAKLGSADSPAQEKNLEDKMASPGVDRTAPRNYTVNICTNQDVWQAAIEANSMRSKLQELTGSEAPPSIVLQTAKQQNIEVLSAALGSDKLGDSVCGGLNAGEVEVALPVALSGSS